MLTVDRRGLCSMLLHRTTLFSIVLGDASQIRQTLDVINNITFEFATVKRSTMCTRGTVYVARKTYNFRLYFL